MGLPPEALFNFLLLLGWAPGDDREVMTREEMIEAFTLDRCRSSASRFDLKKLAWMNGEYVRAMRPEDFLDAFAARLSDARFDLSAVPPSALAEIARLVQQRTRFFAEIPGNCAYFFTEDYPFDPKAVAKRLASPEALALLRDVADAFAALPDFTAESAEAALRAMGEARGSGLGALVHPVRVAVSGMGEGPGLFEMLALLGRDRVIARLRKVAGQTSG
jgi:glutamyl/glutaminyl-tRNA synthetase